MKQIFGIAIVILFCFGCKKSNNNIASPCRLISVITSTNDTFHIVYNNEGKINSVTFKSIISNYTYSGNTTTIIKVIDGLYSGRTVITNNTIGLAINVKTELDASGSDWINTTYEYNGEELFRSTRTNSDGGTPSVTTYEWINSNLVSMTTGSTTDRMEYFTDKPSQEGDYFSLVDFIQGYDIFRTKNLIKSIFGEVILYEFRADKKISSLTTESGITVRYDYECK